MGKVASFIWSQVGVNEALCLQEVGISGEETTRLCARWTPNCSWSVDTTSSSRVGAFIILGEHWIIVEGGNRGDGTFV